MGEPRSPIARNPQMLQMLHSSYLTLPLPCFFHEHHGLSCTNAGCHHLYKTLRKLTGNSQLCGSACELSDALELSEALSSRQLGMGLLGYAAVSEGYHHQIKGSKEKPFPNRSKPPLKQLETLVTSL